jgi:hypothetical protein
VGIGLVVVFSNTKTETPNPLNRRNAEVSLNNERANSSDLVDLRGYCQTIEPYSILQHLLRLKFKVAWRIFFCSLDGAIAVNLLSFYLYGDRTIIIIIALFSMVCLLQLLLVGFSSGVVSQSARPAFARHIASLDVAVETASIKNGMTRSRTR